MNERETEVAALRIRLVQPSRILQSMFVIRVNLRGNSINLITRVCFTKRIVHFLPLEVIHITHFNYPFGLILLLYLI